MYTIKLLLDTTAYLVDGSEDHPGDHSNGTFLAAAFHDALIFGLVIRGLLAFTAA